MKVLVLGATGMLGNAMFRLLSQNNALEVYGTARNIDASRFFPAPLAMRLMTSVDVENLDSLTGTFGAIRPAVVINCIGLVKQLSNANDPLLAVPINALLPHRLARLCSLVGARLIHISTDCVFSGDKGNYTEEDFPDCRDLYGRSKLIGEVNCPDAITLRTSIIGHELNSSRGLIGWFLGQSGKVKGFTRAIFSGLPTIELAQVVRDRVLPNPDLCGVFHVSTSPINKYDLLQLVKSIYGSAIEIEPDESLVINRSLDSAKFRQATGYEPPSWEQLVRQMQEFR